MKKHRWIWVGLLGAGALTAVVALGGCADRRSGQGGHQGGRYAIEAAPRGERTATIAGPGRSGRQGRGDGLEEQKLRGRRDDSAVQAADRRGSGRGVAGPAANAVENDRRSVVETGELLSLAGSLESRDSEWYLNEEGSRYALRLGNARYVESIGIRLQEGAEVQVRGFAEDGEVAVVSILMDGRRFDFRNEDGTPLWAGRGRRAAGGDRTGAGRESGRGNGGRA
jgi:hypothetical protein